jgi:hypothetical protein
MTRDIAAILTLAAFSLAASAQSVPFIDQPLVPSAVKDGGPAFTLTVNGGGFESGSVILWNGSAVSTTHVSSTRLTAQIPASKIASPETALVSVSSGPKLTSNQAFLQVEAPRPVVAFAPSYLSGVVPRALASGDFNGDGNQDIVTWVSNNTIQLLLGNGNGTFQSPITLPVDISEVNQILAADFNGDGKLDLVVLSDREGGSAVYLGDGNGAFQGAQTLPVADDEVVFAAAGDFNGDGKLDLIVPAEQGTPSEAFSLLLGNGDGTFQLEPPNLGSPGFDELAADFNNDGELDLAGIGPGPKIELLLQTSVLATPTGLAFQTIPVATTSQPLSAKVSNISSSPLAIAVFT